MSSRDDHRRWADHAIGRAAEHPQTPMGNTLAIIAVAQAVLALTAEDALPEPTEEQRNIAKAIKTMVERGEL